MDVIALKVYSALDMFDNHALFLLLCQCGVISLEFEVYFMFYFFYLLFIYRFLISFMYLTQTIVVNAGNS